MYVYMYMYAYIYMYTCIHLNICIYIHIFTYIGLLANGTPPEAPRLWEGAVGGEGPAVRGSKKGSLMSSRDGGLQASSTGVMVQWGPVKGDSVSFFSLEFAGATGRICAYIYIYILIHVVEYMYIFLFIYFYICIFSYLYVYIYIFM
jgi:hypothetical protein